MLDISPSHLSEIESGSKSVSFDLLQRYSEVFEIPVSSITMFAEMSATSNDSRSRKMKALISDKALRLLDWLDSVSSVHEKAKSPRPKPPKA